MRLRLLLLQLAVIANAGCDERRSDPASATRIGVVGTQWQLADVRPTAWSQSDADPRVTGTCRVVVVTTADCGVAKTLMVGWTQDVKTAIDSSQSQATAAWIVFDSNEDVDQLISRHVVGVPSLWVHHGGLSEMEAFLQVNGSPQTFVVDSLDRIQAAFAGNAIVPADALRKACGTPQT